MPPRFDIRYDTSGLHQPVAATSIDDDPLLRAMNAHPSYRNYLSDPDPSPEEYDRLVNNSRDYLSDPDLSPEEYDRLVNNSRDYLSDSDPTPEEYDRLVASATSVYRPPVRDFLAEWDALPRSSDRDLLFPNRRHRRSHRHLTPEARFWFAYRGIPWDVPDMHVKGQGFSFRANKSSRFWKDWYDMVLDEFPVYTRLSRQHDGSLRNDFFFKNPADKALWHGYSDNPNLPTGIWYEGHRFHPFALYNFFKGPAADLNHQAVKAQLDQEAASRHYYPWTQESHPEHLDPSMFRSWTNGSHPTWSGSRFEYVPRKPFRPRTMRDPRPHIHLQRRRGGGFEPSRRFYRRVPFSNWLGFNAPGNSPFITHPFTGSDEIRHQRFDRRRRSTFWLYRALRRPLPPALEE
jgi:hypothetical protein